jgi:hypothetical protein
MAIFLLLAILVGLDFFIFFEDFNLLLFIASITPPSSLRSKNSFFYGEIRNLKVNSNPIAWYGPSHDLTARLRN